LPNKGDLRESLVAHSHPSVLAFRLDGYQKSKKRAPRNAMRPYSITPLIIPTGAFLVVFAPDPLASNLLQVLLRPKQNKNIHRVLPRGSDLRNMQLRHTKTPDRLLVSFGTIHGHEKWRGT